MLARASSALPSINSKNLSSLPIIFCRENIFASISPPRERGVTYLTVKIWLRDCYGCVTNLDHAAIHSSSSSNPNAKRIEEDNKLHPLSKVCSGDELDLFHHRRTWSRLGHDENTKSRRAGPRQPRLVEH